MNSTKPRTGPNTNANDASVPRILAVDDHPANLVALEAILEPLGVQIVTAASGEEALIEVLRSDFALILMDVQMPGLDGFATTSMIKKRQRSRHVPVIFLTAISRDEQNIFQGYTYGAVDYLVKPFDPAILRAKVGVFVELWSQKQIVQRQQVQLLERERQLFAAQNDARFHHLADALPDVVWIVDANGAVRFANHAAKELLGGTGRPDYVSNLDVLHPEDAGRVEEQWREALSTGQPFEWHARLRLDGREGSGIYRWYLGQARPEPDKAGPASWIATATDVDDRRRAEQVLSAAPRIAHELQRSLAGTMDRLRRVLDGDVTDEEREEELREILASAETQQRLAVDLAEMSERAR